MLCNKGFLAHFPLFWVLIFSVVAFSCQSQDRASSYPDNQVLVSAEPAPVPPETLLKNVNDHIKAKRFSDAKWNLEVILEKHVGTPEFTEASKLIKHVDEEISWSNATTIDGVENYISAYPRGRYVSKARSSLKALKTQREKDDYERALAMNSSDTWAGFILNYPNHTEKEKIKRKIIQLEVEEIMRNSETGSIPSSSQTGYGYSSTSTVKISNDTGCELTIRYSGTDVRRIDIPAGETRSVSLASGSYKIAASACGSHYAGTEDLGGRYTSSYYIVTTRY